MTPTFWLKVERFLNLFFMLFLCVFSAKGLTFQAFPTKTVLSLTLKKSQFVMTNLFERENKLQSCRTEGCSLHSRGEVIDSDDGYNHEFHRTR